MILILMLKLLSVTVVVKSEDCDMRCSNFVQFVCGMATAWDGTVIISQHLNICHLNKIKCRLKNIAEVVQITNEKCRIKDKSSRRVFDFGIVGAHQACNHTCPTYCVDTYEPVCAQIWKHGMKKYSYRPMVNHCHVDLFSCSVGVNVTITPLGKCFMNPAGLLFMSQMAAMKSLGFLDGTHTRRNSVVKMQEKDAISNDAESRHTEWEMEHLLRRMLMSILSNRLMRP